MKNKNKNKRQKGYTLMEILIVVVIIGAMGYFSIPMYNKIINKADVSDALHNIDMFSGAQAKYFIENGRYTSNLSTLETPLKGEKAEIDTTRFNYYAGDPREDNYCIYSESNTKKYTLARNYRTNSEIFCEGSDCGKIESFVKEGNFKDLCGKNGTPGSCNNTEESCKAINPNWILFKDCSCGCPNRSLTVCSSNQVWSEEKCDCVDKNSCDLTEEKCKTLYTANHVLIVDGSGDCKCECGLNEEKCKANNAEGFNEEKCSCVCMNDDVKKCAEQNKVLTGDCQCVCAEIKKCEKGYVFSNEKCECIETDCTTTEEECKKKNEKWTLLEDCSCGCEKIESCGTDAIWNSMKCVCEKKDCTKDDDYCKKYFGEDYYINTEKCECVKKECDKTDDYCKKYYSEDYYLNTEKCECVKKECDKTDDYCKKYYGEDYYLNTEKCECVKKECDKTEEECVKEFGKYFVLNNQECSCECGLTEEKCKNEGGALNKEKCSCEQTGCTKTEEECKKMNKNYILDTSICNCKCGLVEKDCTSQGLSFNNAKCMCEGEICDKTDAYCKKMNSNWSLLSDCTCGCPKVLTCPKSQVWNSETCLCEKNSCNGLTDDDCKAQNPNFYLEGTKCRCLCGIDKFKCNELYGDGAWFDIDNCVCVP